VKKSNYIIFGHEHKPCVKPSFPVILNGNVLERVVSTKFLGVYIDQNLDWKQHTSHTCLKISRSLGILNCVKSMLTLDLLKTLYHTMIHPDYLYCMVVWGGACKLAVNKLICLQKRAVHLLTHSTFLAQCNPLFVRLGILKLTDINKLQFRMFMYNAKHDVLPVSSSRHVHLARLNLRFSFRVNFDFKRIDCRTLVRERYIGIAGPKLWNILPQAIKVAGSLCLFKQKLKDYLLELSI